MLALISVSKSWRWMVISYVESPKSLEPCSQRLAAALLAPQRQSIHSSVVGKHQLLDRTGDHNGL